MSETVAKEKIEEKIEEVIEKPIQLPEKLIAGSLEEIWCLVRARIPYVQVVSHEESRFIKDVYEQICKSKKRDLYIWSSFLGLNKYSDSFEINPKRASGEFAESQNPSKALQMIQDVKIAKPSNGAIFILKDFHTVLQMPIPRQMRDIYFQLIKEGKSIIILGGQLAHGPGGTKGGIEPTLEKQMTIVRYTLPTREQIEARIKAFVEDDEDKNAVKYTDEEMYQFSRALQGLTYTEIDNAVSISLAHLRRLDLTRLRNEKKQVIMRNDILEYIETNNQLEGIGGMDHAKKYFLSHRNTHTEAAEAFGVEPLKGILLTGIPGTGKSQLAKSLGNLWNVPTLRLDVGKVMTGLVGGSEEKMRAVVAQAKSIAPCVTGDTLVMLANGKEITIEKLYDISLQLGENSIELMAWDPDINSLTTIQLHEVIRREASNKIILEITTENGVIKVTDNHKLLTPNGWVEAKDLKPGMDVLDIADHQKDTLSYINSMLLSEDESM